ncbi:MAG: GntR family transcriptional regulator [Clostridia bacterium]|nr:GntR family transcriptional regulator [Clostridia bacterium]
MISFDNFKLRDGIPVYLQILEHIKQGIVAGEIVNNDELPSRRVLSALLGLNPNTVQKAYRILEDEGLIESHAGAKSYMRLDGEKLRRVRDELIERVTLDAAEAFKRMGLTKAEAAALLERYWSEVEEEK